MTTLGTRANDDPDDGEGEGLPDDVAILAIVLRCPPAPPPTSYASDQDRCRAMNERAAQHGWTCARCAAPACRALLFRLGVPYRQDWRWVDLCPPCDQWFRDHLPP